MVVLMASLFSVMLRSNGAVFAMSGSAKCPSCGKEVLDEPLSKWKFRFYDVRRYECAQCKNKFNLYDSPKSKFVISGKRHK